MCEYWEEMLCPLPTMDFPSAPPDQLLLILRNLPKGPSDKPLPTPGTELVTPSSVFMVLGVPLCCTYHILLWRFLPILPRWTSGTRAQELCPTPLCACSVLLALSKHSRSSKNVSLSCWWDAVGTSLLFTPVSLWEIGFVSRKVTAPIYDVKWHLALKLGRIRDRVSSIWTWCSIICG